MGGDNSKAFKVLSRKSEARWSGVSGGRRMRAGFLLQEEEEERAKGHSLLDSTSRNLKESG